MPLLRPCNAGTAHTASVQCATVFGWYSRPSWRLGRAGCLRCGFLAYSLACWDCSPRFARNNNASLRMESCALSTLLPAHSNLRASYAARTTHGADRGTHRCFRVWWGQLTHLLRVLQVQTTVQANVVYKIQQLNVRAPARVSNVGIGVPVAHTVTMSSLAAQPPHRTSTAEGWLLLPWRLA